MVMPDPWVSKAEKNAPRSIFGRYLAAGNFQFLKNVRDRRPPRIFAERARSEGTPAPTHPPHWAVWSDPTFFTDPIFPTRFPTELLTTGREMA
jgi:hypothetical protein